MANELAHKTCGAALSQAEFEDVTLHVCNSQATGDLIYASSATQLTRLGIGATSTFLQVVGGIPAWVANPILGGYLKLYITDSDSSTEGQIWYDDSENVIKYYNGSTVKTLSTTA